MAISRSDGLRDDAPVPDLPGHWNFGGEIHPTRVPRNPRLLIHQLLCIIGFGCASMHTVWRKSHETTWRIKRDGVRDRLQHVNVVAALLLTTISAFCTTEPPANSRILPYTKTVPYCLLLVSMGFTIVGLAVGSFISFLIHKMDPTWFRDVLMGSRCRIWVVMTMLSLPFFLTAVSMLFFTIGLLTAAASSEIPFVKFGLAFTMLPGVASMVAFLWFVLCRPGVLRRLPKCSMC